MTKRPPKLAEIFGGILAAMADACRVYYREVNALRAIPVGEQGRLHGRSERQLANVQRRKRPFRGLTRTRP